MDKRLGERLYERWDATNRWQSSWQYGVWHHDGHFRRGLGIKKKSWVKLFCHFLFSLRTVSFLVSFPRSSGISGLVFFFTKKKTKHFDSSFMTAHVRTGNAVGPGEWLVSWRISQPCWLRAKLHLDARWHHQYDLCGYGGLSEQAIDAVDPGWEKFIYFIYLYDSRFSIVALLSFTGLVANWLGMGTRRNNAVFERHLRHFYEWTASRFIKPGGGVISLGVFMFVLWAFFQFFPPNHRLFSCFEL